MMTNFSTLENNSSSNKEKGDGFKEMIIFFMTVMYRRKLK